MTSRNVHPDNRTCVPGAFTDAGPASCRDAGSSTIEEPREAMDQASRAALEHGLSQYFGRERTIVDVVLRPMSAWSTHPIDRLSIELDGWDHISIIYKRYRQMPDRDPRAEILLYERLLTDQRFGAPALYASVIDAERGRYWLFLEDVGNWRLEYFTVDGWLDAFRWLAGMHSAYAGQEADLIALGCLREHGPEFYRSLMKTARRSLERYGEAEALSRFDLLMDQWFNHSMDYLVRRPRTIVHGDLSCKNLMVDGDGNFRPVDWEWAGVGVAAWDVSKLLAGWGADKPRLLDAYMTELEHGSDAPVDRMAMRRDIVHCETLHALWYLGWWIEPCQDPAYVERVLEDMGSKWQCLETGAPDV